MKSLKIIFLISAMFCSQLVSAQITNYFEKFRPAKRWSLGLQVSPTHTMGDADDTRIGLAFGGHLKYSVSQTFGLKLNGNIGTLQGSRKEQDSYFFKNNFKDLNLTAQLTLGNISFLRPLRKVQLYFFTGFGVIWSDVKGQYETEADAVTFYNAYGDEYFTPEYNNNNNLVNAISTYKGNNFTVPLGFGFKRNMGKMLDIGIEYKNHFTGSDNIDGFSFPVWRNRLFDFYGLLSVQASIKLGGKDGIDDHYDWLNPVESIYSTLDSLQILEEKVDLMLLDTDNDGVADYWDKEPDTDKNAWVWGSGEAADIDTDGVPDFKDAEPYSEKGAIVDADGVMIDVDNDGVPDYRDEDTKSQSGVLVNPRTGTSVKVGGNTCCDCEDVFLPSVVFDNGSANIKPEFYGSLYSVAEKMKACPDLKILASGYAVRSKSGSQLAFKRANAIIDYLNANYNIPRDRFSMDTEGSAPDGIDYASRRIDLMKIR
ncbi:MAG: outer membrane protein OmpA-like peptidoglycan-associated protein [Bacteroidia bacterium]|jgi:outer membrane protein OmpA-like peptidoglycan-associated protein